MTIVILQDYLRSGGTERQSVLLADAFAAKGHRVILLCFRPGGPLAPTLAQAERSCLQTFDTHLDWFAPGLLRRLRRLGPDVVLCMGRMANCHAGRIQHKFPGCVVVSTMRTGKALPWLFRRALRVTRHVVANSRDAANCLVEHYGLPASKVSVINNSVVFKERIQVAQGGPSLRDAHGASASTIVLVCVAMFRPEKNQAELIDICAGLPGSLDWQLWFAGDGPALGHCVQKAEGLGLGKRVRFLGWNSNPGPVYEAGNIAVHASTSEALSNFLIEAQYRGLPCVAFKAQGNGECMIPGKTGFIIPPGNHEAFREAILQLAGETSEARDSRARLARAHARESFDETRQVNAYLSLFQKLRPD